MASTTIPTATTSSFTATVRGVHGACDGEGSSGNQAKMDDPGIEQSPIIPPVQFPYMNPYQANQMMSTAPAYQAQQLAQEQLSYQQKQHHLDEQLKMFQTIQKQEIMAIKDFKNHSLPLARIKKIMKADEDVKMIAAEAPLLFSRACEMFIMELTCRSWVLATENKRRTLLKSDIGGAISRTEILDFLVDVVPKEDPKESGHGAGSSVGGFDDPFPYYCVPPHVGALGGVMSEPEIDQSFPYGQIPQNFVPQQHMWEQQQKTQQQYGEDAETNDS